MPQLSSAHPPRERVFDSIPPTFFVRNTGRAGRKAPRITSCAEEISGLTPSVSEFRPPRRRTVHLGNGSGYRAEARMGRSLPESFGTGEERSSSSAYETGEPNIRFGRERVCAVMAVELFFSLSWPEGVPK